VDPFTALGSGSESAEKLRRDLYEQLMEDHKLDKELASFLRANRGYLLLGKGEGKEGERDGMRGTGGHRLEINYGSV
jgi:hypothetical protein